MQKWQLSLAESCVHLTANGHFRPEDEHLVYLEGSPNWMSAFVIFELQTASRQPAHFPSFNGHHRITGNDSAARLLASRSSPSWRAARKFQMADLEKLKQDLWKRMASSPFLMVGIAGGGHCEPLTAQLDEDQVDTLWFFIGSSNRLAQGGSGIAQFVSKSHDFFASLAGGTVKRSCPLMRGTASCWGCVATSPFRIVPSNGSTRRRRSSAWS